MDIFMSLEQNFPMNATSGVLFLWSAVSYTMQNNVNAHFISTYDLTHCVFNSDTSSTCKSGAWECTETKCSGTCVIYGSGHYSTFDKITYGFQGHCAYVAVKVNNSCQKPTNNQRSLSSHFFHSLFSWHNDSYDELYNQIWSTYLDMEYLSLYCIFVN